MHTWCQCIHGVDAYMVYMHTWCTCMHGVHASSKQSWSAEQGRADHLPCSWWGCPPLATQGHTAHPAQLHPGGPPGRVHRAAPPHPTSSNHRHPPASVHQHSHHLARFRNATLRDCQACHGHRQYKNAQGDYSGKTSLRDLPCAGLAHHPGAWKTLPLLYPGSCSNHVTLCTWIYSKQRPRHMHCGNISGMIYPQ